MHMRSLLAIALTVAVLARGTRAQDLVIAEAGTSAFRIVVAAEASPSTSYAAAELQHWLREMTGAELPVVSLAAGPEAAAPSEHEIILGDARHPRLAALKVEIDFGVLGKEGYVLRTVGPHLVIAGSGMRGALYGVYGLLEDHLGCRWFTPTVSRIPQRPRLALAPLAETKVPRLEYREPFVKDCFDGDWCARNRMNSNAAALTEKHGGKVSYHGFVHTFFELVPPATYYQEHPEYFPLVGGQRLNGYTQLCCTNEEVIRIITEEIRRRMREHPEATVFSVSQNDTGSNCQCPECQKLADQEGTHAAPVLYLVNRVAEAVEKEFPDKAIDTLAYTWTRKPPRTLRPRPNVIVRLCSIECCFAHPLATCDSPENKAFREDIIGWGKVCDRLWIWDYTTSFANYFVPFPNRRVLKPNIRFFADNHVTGIFEEDTYTTLAGEFNLLDGYLQAKFLWDPDCDEGKAMDEFLSGVYGSAAGPIRRYIDLLEDKVAKENIHLHIWEGAGARYLTDDVLAETDRLWEEAEAAVADQAEVLERVRLARLSPDWALIERTQGAVTKPYRIENGRYVADVDAKFAARVNRFFTGCERGGVTALNEGGRTPADYRKTIAPKVGTFEVVSLAGAGLKLDIVPALGGRIVGLQALPNGQPLAYTSAPDDPDYPNAGGYAESWQASRHGPGWANVFDATVADGADAKTVALVTEVADKVRLERRLTVPARGDSFAIVSTLANGRAETQPAVLRTEFSVQLGSTDELTALIPGLAGKGSFSLSLPEAEVAADLSFPGAALAQGVTLVNHAASLGLRFTVPADQVERGWLRVDAKRGFVTFELETKGEVAAGGTTGFRQQVEVLRDVGGLTRVPGTGARTHRALRLVVQDDKIPLARYGEWGWLEADPTAADGFSLHLPNTHIEWCCQWWYSPAQFEPDTRYDVFARIRVDKKGENGSAFWAGIYDTVNAVGLGSIQPGARDIPDKDWHVYKLGTVIPAKGHYVWCGPYGNPENIGGVWLDWFELKAVP
jgi:hypothetical protein